MNRAQDDVIDYTPEWRALAWEVQQILDETHAYNRAQALRLAKLGALKRDFVPSPIIRPEFSRLLSEDETVANLVERLDDVWSDELDGTLADVMADAS